MPYSKSTQKDYGDNPLQKRSGFKMKGMSFKSSPAQKNTGEVVSRTSPGPGWTKTKGTNIWAPPKNDGKGLGLGAKRGLVKKSKKTITNKKSLSPPYKKPVGPRA